MTAVYEYIASPLQACLFSPHITIRSPLPPSIHSLTDPSHHLTLTNLPSPTHPTAPINLPSQIPPTTLALLPNSTMKPTKTPLTDGVISVSVKDRISADGKTIRQKRFIRAAKVRSLSLYLSPKQPSSRARAHELKLKNLHSPTSSSVNAGLSLQLSSYKSLSTN